MSEETKQWTWNNGWILMSVFLVQSNEESTLADVLAAADATNHAIPTPNELSQAFTKLVNAGVLKIEGNNYRISKEYIGDIEKAYKSKGGLFESGNKGKKWLNNSGLEVLKTPKITITQDDVKNAYDVYFSKIKNNG
jgi:hypothetical protein